MHLVAVLALILQDQPAEEAFRKIEQGIKKAKTLTVKFTESGAEGGNQTVARSGTLVLADGNRLNCFVIEGSNVNEKRYRIISDGSKTRGMVHWQSSGWHPPLDQSTPDDLRDHFNLATSRTGLGLLVPDATRAFCKQSEANPKASLFSWNETPTISGIGYGDEEKGSKTLIYKLKLAGKDREADMKIWFHPESFKLVKRTLKLDKLTVTETYEEFTLNADLPEDTFKLSDK